MKPKSIVPRNHWDEAQERFAAGLLPGIEEVRGDWVEFDLGDFVHAILDHEEMQTRVDAIRATLQNPEAIYRHPRILNREIYVNTIYENEQTNDGELLVVVVIRRLRTLDFWTSFMPRDAEGYREFVEGGDLLWNADN